MNVKVLKINSIQYRSTYKLICSYDYRIGEGGGVEVCEMISLEILIVGEGERR